jgi:hypothetical protein
VLLFARDPTSQRETRLGEFEVSNDGANLSSDTCGVRWLLAGHAIAQVTCHGQEQFDDVWLVNLTQLDAWQLEGD